MNIADVWNWHNAFEALPLLLTGLKYTLIATAGGTVFGLVFGLVVALIKLNKIPVLSQLMWALCEVLRGTPLLVQLYFAYFVFPNFGITLDAMTIGMICLGLYDGVYMSEAYRSAIDSVPREQKEGALALSIPRHRWWLRILIPQALPAALPPLGNYVIMMFKQSALLATIAVPELLHEAQSYGQNTYRYVEAMTLAAVLFLIVSVAASVLLRKAERRTSYVR